MNAKNHKVLSRTFCGSAAYAAPEVIQNIPYRPKRYDSWSLGVILYVMVCGQLPFDDSNPFQQVRAQMSRQIHFPPAYNLSKMVRNLIRHLLEPFVLYRCSVPRAMKHPWMRKERIKRKLKHMKDSKLSELEGKGARATHSDMSLTRAAPSSPDLVGPRSMSASALQGYGRGGRSPNGRARFTSESPTYYSRTTLASQSDQGPICWQQQPGMPYTPNPLFQQPMRHGHGVVNTNVHPYTTGGYGMYGGATMMDGGMMGGGYPPHMGAGGMFPMQGAPMMGMPPPPRRGGRNLNLHIGTPCADISVSSSSSGSYAG